jgi:hypothetical protein
MVFLSFLGRWCSWLLEIHGLEVSSLVLEGGLGVEFVLVLPPVRKTQKYFFGT